MGRMIDMTEGEAEYLKYRFKQYLGSVSRAIQNKRLREQKMGMTIDEAIYCMKSYLPSDDYTHCTECKYYGCNDNKTCKSSEAHQKAIETMRKYQEIQKIVTNKRVEEQQGEDTDG